MNKILDMSTHNTVGIVNYLNELFDYNFVTAPRVGYEKYHTDLGTKEKLTLKQIDDVLHKIELTGLRFVDFKGFVHNIDSVYSGKGKRFSK